MQAKKYVVDVAALHRLQERNYAGLQHLLPGANRGREIRIGALLRFQLTTTAQSRYTTDIELRQLESHWATDYLVAQLDIRLYHDVRMAEVTASQGVRRLAAHYRQPNPEMRHRDEKAQVNQFLADWLALCREQGELTADGGDKFVPHGFK